MELAGGKKRQQKKKEKEGSIQRTRDGNEMIARDTHSANSIITMKKIARRTKANGSKHKRKRKGREVGKEGGKGKGAEGNARESKTQLSILKNPRKSLKKKTFKVKNE